MHQGNMREINPGEGSNAGSAAAPRSARICCRNRSDVAVLGCAHDDDPLRGQVFLIIFISVAVLVGDGP